MPSDNFIRYCACVAHFKVVEFASNNYELQNVPPTQMSMLSLLLASGSLRSLFVDKGHDNILLDFKELEEYLKVIEIDFIETDISMLSFSKQKDQDYCVADMFYDIISNEDKLDQFELNRKQQHFVVGGSEMYSSLQKDRNVWQSDKSNNRGLSILPDGSFSEWIFITRRKANVFSWINSPIGMLNNILWTRANVISYAANKLCGIHYDKDRVYSDKKGRSSYITKTQALDWESRAERHGALNAIGLLCAELHRSDLTGLISEIHQRILHRI